jgi:zinc protease
MIRILLLLSLLLALPVAAQNKIPLTDFTLSNGLRVLVLEDKRAPVVLHALAYDVGAADEVDGKTGLAHFLEHLMFRGTARFPAGVFDQLMDDNGASKNAFTSHDITMYYARGAKELLPLFMELEADRMKNLVLDAKVFEVERKVVQEERRQRIEGSPMGAPMEKLDQRLYAPHPYGRPVIGTPEDVASVSVDDVMAFYRQYYQPRRATLVVAGDVSPGEVRKLVTQYYGELANDGPDTMLASSPLPALAGAQRFAASDPRLGSPVLVRKYLGPAIGTSTVEERAALSVLTMVLSGHPQAKLELDLVQRRGLATWAAASYSGAADRVGNMIVYAAPTPGTSLDQLEKEVDGLLVAVANGQLAEADLTLPKQMARASFIYGLDDLSGVGRSLGIGVVMGAEIEDMLQRHEIIARVTKDDVIAAARRIFNNGTHVTLQMTTQ